MKRDEPTDFARLMASECLAVRVRRLGRVITRVYDAALAPHGITIAQLNLLTAIVAADGARLTDLGRILDVEKSTLSRDLQRMELLGWIRFDPRQSSRGRTISLTPAGTRLFLEVRPAWEKAQETARSQLGRRAFARLRNLLQPIGP
ncbi:MAG TPA: MarR family winged helix-turn-helix transcriptional regulator [Myxococcales bacterium]|nr:MarR family winged helix-turn-helix transcriptional regulator [Myxococcales bacterium]